MSNVKPEFEFDVVGRVFCIHHPNFPLFMEYKQTPLPIYQSKRLYTCKTCNHYKDNNCQFPRRKIRKILLGVRFHRYRCEICGGNIDRMFNIIYKKQLGQKKVKVPMLCCDCVWDLTQKDVIKAFKKRRKEMFFVALSLIIISISFFIIFNMIFHSSLPSSIFINIMSSLFFIWGAVILRNCLILSKSTKHSSIIKNLIDRR